ncbi:glycosidase [Mobilisporobacter senegalensis]|uniref:Alpha-amylase n=1 Tax=Mobilisporobacter senegalensis TaxID=1329262 RepID=A0A3N1XA82_9FIRM|nr:alpha-amylase family glycosyl hydrolase [Mobilisporobacter senegalensis]ROR23680.1 glycosidase [Mobilisporobacter senegalensis]
MKNRKQKLLIIILVLLSVVSCKYNEDKVNQGENKIEKKEGIKETISYPYKQDLNVPEDNYRTYYEVFLYSYYDSNGDGIGDINGLIKKLDYINDGDPDTDTDLGFNGIWLMPIMPSTTYHKYDVTDYYSIDTQYGTMEDFKNLVKECDKRGIKLIIDMVFNHTSSKHPWFLSAIQSLSIEPCGEEVCTHEELCRQHNKYIGYYNFVKDKPGSGIYYPTGNGWYYEGVFWDQMPDLNLSNEDLRRDLEDVMSYWLDLGVGGFRLDAAKEYYSGAPTKNIEVLSWINEFVKRKSVDNYIVAEVWDSFSVYSTYYKSNIDSVFNFAFAKEDGKIVKTLNYSDTSNSGSAFADALILADKTFKGMNEKAIDAPFFTNHDTARAAGFFVNDENKLKMAAAMNLFMNGSAFVYYGEELGMKGSGKDENKRAPMYWSGNEKAEGMTTGPPNMEEVKHIYPSLEEQEQDPGSIYNFYKRAIRLRNENPEIARGTLERIDNITDIDICAVTKTYKGSKIVMLYNLSTEEKSVDLVASKIEAEGIRGYVSATGKEVLIKEERAILPPYSVVVLK